MKFGTTTLVALLAAVAVGLLIAGFMLRRQRPKESLKG